MRSLILAAVLVTGCAATNGTWRGDSTHPEWTVLQLKKDPALRASWRYDVDMKVDAALLEPLTSMRNAFVLIAKPDCGQCQLIRDWWKMSGSAPKFAKFIYIEVADDDAEYEAKSRLDRSVLFLYRAYTGSPPQTFETGVIGAVLQPIRPSSSGDMPFFEHVFRCRDIRTCTEGLETFIRHSD